MGISDEIASQFFSALGSLASKGSKMAINLYNAHKEAETRAILDEVFGNYEYILERALLGSSKEQNRAGNWLWDYGEKHDNKQAKRLGIHFHEQAFLQGNFDSGKWLDEHSVNPRNKWLYVGGSLFVAGVIAFFLTIYFGGGFNLLLKGAIFLLAWSVCSLVCLVISGAINPNVRQIVPRVWKHKGKIIVLTILLVVPITLLDIYSMGNNQFAWGDIPYIIIGVVGGIFIAGKICKWW